MSDGVLRENKAAPVQVSYLGLTPSGTPGPALVARSRAAGSFSCSSEPSSMGQICAPSLSSARSHELWFSTG